MLPAASSKGLCGRRPSSRRLHSLGSQVHEPSAGRGRGQDEVRAEAWTGAGRDGSGGRARKGVGGSCLGAWSSGGTEGAGRGATGVVFGGGVVVGGNVSRRGRGRSAVS